MSHHYVVRTLSGRVYEIDLGQDGTVYDLMCALRHSGEYISDDIIYQSGAYPRGVTSFEEDTILSEYDIRVIQLASYNPRGTGTRTRVMFVLNSPNKITLKVLSIEEVCEAIKSVQIEAKAASCEVVMQHLTKHKEDEQVVKYGCFAIVKLIRKESTLCSTLGSLDACSLLVELLGAHSTSAVVVSYVCWAIGTLADDITNRAKLVDAGACEALVAALKRNTWHSDIALAVSWSFANLALETSTRTKLGLAGACQLQVQAMRAHANYSQVAEKGCRSVINLCCSCDGVGADAASNSSNNNRKCLKKSGVIDVLEAMLTNYALNEATRNKAKEALAMLSS